MQPKDIKRLQSSARRMRARVIAPDTLIVESRSNPNAHHIVTIETQTDGSLRGRCTCPWAQNGGYGCSHVLAALQHLADTRKRALSFWLNKQDAERQRHRILHLAGDYRDQDNGIWITTRPVHDERV